MIMKVVSPMADQHFYKFQYDHKSKSFCPKKYKNKYQILFLKKKELKKHSFVQIDHQLFS